MSGAVQLLLLVGVLVVFWAIVMRPARNQQRKMQEFQHEVQVGDEVVISAGIFGTVRSVDGARVRLEIAPGTEITVARQVVVRRAEDVPAEDSASSKNSSQNAGENTDAADAAAPNPVTGDEESE